MALDVEGLDFKIVASDMATDVIKKVSGAVGGLERDYMKLVGTLTAGLSLGGFVAMVDGAIKAQAQLDHLAKATGATVQGLSALRSVAKLSGTDLDTVGQALVMLSRNMASVDKDSSKAAMAMRAIGVSVDELKGRRTDEAMLEIAKALARFEDGMGKTAVATAIFGRGAAQMLPVLADLAAKGDLNGRVTADQAKAAEEAEKAIAKLKTSMKEMANDLATVVAPYITKFIEQLVEGKKIAGGLFEAIRLFGLGTSPFDSLADGLAKVRGQLEQLQKMKADKSLSGNIDGIGIVMRTQVDAQIADTQKKLDYLKMLQRQQALEGGPHYGNEGRGADRPKSLDFKYEDPAKVDATANAYQNLIKQIEERIAQTSLEVAAGEKLTEGEKLAAAAMVQLRDGYLKTDDAGKVLLRTKLEQLIANDKAIKAAKDEAAAQAELEKQRIVAIESIAKMNAAARDRVESIARDAEAIERQAQAYGETKEAIAELEIARLEERKNFLSQAEGYDTEVAAIDRLIAAKRNLAQTESRVDEARRQAEEWKKTYEAIDRGLTDALMRGFESGKSFAYNFRDALVNMFKTLVLKPVIQYVLAPVSGALAGLVPGAAAAGGGSASMAGSSLGLLGSLTNFGSTSAWGSIATSSLGNTLGLSMATESGTMLTALGSTIGTAIPYVGAALALGSALGLFKGGGGPKSPTLGISTSGAGGPVGSLAVSQNNFGDAGSLSVAQAQAINAYLDQLPDKLKTALDGFMVELQPGATAAQAWEQIQAQIRATAQSVGLTADELKRLNPLEQQQAENTQLATARRQLEIQLMDAQGDAAGALAARRQDELAALDESLRPLAQQIYAAQDLAKANEAAAQAAQKLADKEAAIAAERKGLQDQLDELTMTSAQLLEKQRAALDPSNQALFDQVVAAKAAAAQTEALAASMNTYTASAAETASAFDQLVAWVDKWHAAQDKVRSAQDNIVSIVTGFANALTEAKAAVKSAQQAISDEYLAARKRASDYAKSIREFLDTSGPTASLDSLKAQFSVQETLARAGDVDAQKKLLDVMQKIQDTARAQSVSAADYAIMVAPQRAALERLAADLDAGKTAGLKDITTAAVASGANMDASKIPSTSAALLEAWNKAVKNANQAADDNTEAGRRAFQKLGVAIDQLAPGKFSQLGRALEDYDRAQSDLASTMGGLVTVANTLGGTIPLTNAQVDLLGTKLGITADAMGAFRAALVDPATGANISVQGFAVTMLNVTKPGGPIATLATAFQALAGIIAALKFPDWMNGGGGAPAPARVDTWNNNTYTSSAGATYNAATDTTTSKTGVTVSGDVMRSTVMGYLNSGDGVGLVGAAKAWGVSAAGLAEVIHGAVAMSGLGGSPTGQYLMNMSETDVRKWAADHGVAFATGGLFDGGLRLVGERGMELEATGPARLWSADQTRAMLSGSSGELVAEVKALRAAVERLERPTLQAADAAARTENTLRIVTRSGRAMQTEAFS